MQADNRLELGQESSRGGPIARQILETGLKRYRQTVHPWLAAFP
jgi:hypothetical protein